MAHRGEAAHRGEVFAPAGFAMGTNRLGIVDEAHGRQPFRSLDGRTVCVINGEIYNHDELRRELPDYEFRSRCDAEVVLAGFLRWGIAVVRRLRGMFAIAIADSDGRLWLARDPLGIKPLYWARKGGCTLVASELKGFVGLVAARIDELRPGHIWCDGTATPYWQCAAFAGPADREPEALDEARAVLARSLRESVATHLPPGDAPVACLLSGGVDSSTVTALVHQQHPAGAEAWTFAAGGAHSEDLASAQLLTSTLGMPLRIVSPSVEELKRFYMTSGVLMTETWEPALVRNAVSYHFLCRAVRGAGYKVCLSGEGANEVFGGYAYLDQFPAGERDATIRDSLVEVYRTYAQMADRASMFATLEVRVPFLDRCLVDAAVTLPSGARYRDGLNKRALRELYPGLLPQRIRLRPKEGMNQGAGFGTNDPGSSIYYAAVERHYAHHPVAARNDLEQARRHGDGYGVNLNDIEEIYNFSRYIRLGFHRLEPDRPRPQLNVSTLRATAGQTRSA